MRNQASWLALLAQLLLFTMASLLAEHALDTPAHAQPGDPTADAGGPATTPAAAEAIDPNLVVPPHLQAFVDAGYPDQAMVDGALAGAAVMLLITIGEDGFVEEVSAAGEAAGHGFDEAAGAAARRFVFEPAQKGGAPMRSRIQYRYEFKPYQAPPAATAEPAATPERAPSGKIEISVRNAEDGDPVADAEVLVSSPSDLNLAVRLVTDAQGKARSDELPVGPYDVRASKKDFGDETHSEEVLPDQVTEVLYRLRKLQSYEEYGAVARVKAPPREVTRRTIEREELTRVAGTRGDALRTIELLPGVSRPPFGSGLVLIRGSAPGDSEVFLDGAPVPLLYHFGGLTSFINSRALDRIDFYPGNFSVKYGRRVGGVIDVGTRDPATDKIHGVLDMNLPLDSSLLLEGPITEKLSILVAGRRSYFGEVARAIIPAGTFSAFAAPVYNDYQLFLVYKPTDRDRIRLSVYGSGDRLEILFADAPDSDPTIRGLEIGENFHRQQIGWSHRYSDKLDHNIEASFGRINNNFSFGPELNFKLSNNVVYLRGELRYRYSPALQLTVGTDSGLGRYEVRYNGPQFGNDEGDAGGGPNVTALDTQRFSEAGVGYAPSLYAELAVKPTEKLRIVPGLRLDYTSRIHEFTFDPRFAAIYSLTDNWRIKGGVGMFSQAPSDPQAARSVGNPNLQSTRALHYGAGFEHNFTQDLSLGVEGFYKTIYRRVIAPEDGQPRFNNDGTGRIYGLEVAGRKQASGRWFGFLSYTLMRSERKEPGSAWRPFDYDQRHILTFASTVRLGRGWELGGTLRVITGNPRTPYQNPTSFSLTDGDYSATPGRINSARAPTFNRIDVRVEKKWTFNSWRLAWYLDVQNAYNARNPEGTTYSFDYAQSAPIRGLPIIPIIGLRGEL